MATKPQTNNVEQAVETVKETEAAVGQDSVTIADNTIADNTVEDAMVVDVVDSEPVQQTDVVVSDYVKPTFEFVRVDAFLSVEIVVGQPAYIRVLGEFDTKDMVSTVPVFTQLVTAITDNGFETDDAVYVEVV